MKNLTLLLGLIVFGSVVSASPKYPHCVFYPELCISVEGPEKIRVPQACQAQGNYCAPGSTNICCPGLKCVPSGSALIGGHKCLTVPQRWR